MSKGVITCIVNQKGGVGKTTTAVNLSAALAAVYKNTLLVDCDPQGNTSSSFNSKLVDAHLSSYALFTQSQDKFEDRIDKTKAEPGSKHASSAGALSNIIQKTFVPHLNLIQGHKRLYNLDNELIQDKNKDFKLLNSLRPLAHAYDYTFIDCPPSLNSITINALTVAHYALIPVQCEYYSLEGLSQILSTIKSVAKNFNQNLRIIGILLTMLDKRNSHCRMIMEDVRTHLKDLVFTTAIPRNIKVSEAASFGKPVLFYDLNCPASKAYLTLTKEFIERAK